MVRTGTERVTSARANGRLVVHAGTVLTVVGGSLVAVASPASAIESGCTLEVTSTANSGPGTLRDALACATDGDIITFDLGIGTHTIDLDSGLGVSNNVSIDGPGSEELTISLTTVAETGSSVFYIYGESPGTVQISGLTVTGGHSDSDGGGIRSVDDELVLEDVAVVGNDAAARGGGVFVGGGSLTLRNSTVSGNTAADGGGVMVDGRGTVTVTGVAIDSSNITGNVATDTGETYGKYGGGGVFVLGVDGDVSITSDVTRTVIAGNHSNGKYGGVGISGVSGQVTIESVDIGGASEGDANVADYSAGGIGISNVTGQTMVTNTTISGNTAGIGGGLKYLGGTFLAASSPADAPLVPIEGTGLTLDHTTISGNTGGLGAGVGRSTGT